MWAEGLASDGPRTALAIKRIEEKIIFCPGIDFICFPYVLNCIHQAKDSALEIQEKGPQFFKLCGSSAQGQALKTGNEKTEVQ